PLFPYTTLSRSKKPKKRRAGTAIRRGGAPLRRRLLRVAASCAATDPCESVSVVISERGVHGVDELLRRDLQQEYLAQVAEQLLRRRRRQRLVPGELEVRGVDGEPVGEAQEVRVLALRELVLDPLHRGDGTGLDHLVDLDVVVDVLAEPPDRSLLGAVGGGGGDGEQVGGVAHDVGRIPLSAVDGRERRPAEGVRREVGGRRLERGIGGGEPQQ